MGDEADADWDAGLVEWGIEDTLEKYRETPFTRQFKKDCEELRKKLRSSHPVSSPSRGE
jgi:hypothetical protein